jgi:hypothetical protein
VDAAKTSKSVSHLDYLNEIVDFELVKGLQANKNIVLGGGSLEDAVEAVN